MESKQLESEYIYSAGLHRTAESLACKEHFNETVTVLDLMETKMCSFEEVK